MCFCFVVGRKISKLNKFLVFIFVGKVWYCICFVLLSLLVNIVSLVDIKCFVFYIGCDVDIEYMYYFRYDCFYYVLFCVLICFVNESWYLWWLVGVFEMDFICYGF